MYQSWFEATPHLMNLLLRDCKMGSCSNTTFSQTWADKFLDRVSATTTVASALQNTNRNTLCYYCSLITSWDTFILTESHFVTTFILTEMHYVTTVVESLAELHLFWLEERVFRSVFQQTPLWKAITSFLFTHGAGWTPRCMLLY